MARTDPAFPGVEWVNGTGAFIYPDPEKCTGCGDCVKVCLGGCWTMVGGRAQIKSLATCMECAACWYICDAGAVVFTWPKGGTGYRSEWG